MKDKRTLKESSKIEAIKKYAEYVIRLILLEITSSLNVRVDLTSLSQYAGNYLKSISRIKCRSIRYINLKIKRNATKP